MDELTLQHGAVVASAHQINEYAAQIISAGTEVSGATSINFGNSGTALSECEQRIGTTLSNHGEHMERICRAIVDFADRVRLQDEVAICE